MSLIEDYLKAGYPTLCLLTYEPHRAEKYVQTTGWRFFAWDCISGIKNLEQKIIVDEVKDPVGALHWLGEYRNTVLIAHNLHLFTDTPELIQAIQNGIQRWKSMGSSLVMISPVIMLRPEIEKFFHVIDLPLPDEEELFKLQLDLIKNTNIKHNKKASREARGLTEFEAETAFAYSISKIGYCGTGFVSEAKSQMIKKSGLMEFWTPANIQDVGGLGSLKAFIESRAKAFSQEVESSTLPKLKGILLVGISGTGKSLSSKATASILGWPLIRLDIGSLKHSHVGESERRIRQATQIIDAFGKAVIWIDEVEKMFAGARSSGETDAGTTANMFGHFLTWFSETTTPILVMATANNISQLPTEFMRSGRFDAIFFVDLPTNTERIEIIKIMNRKWNAQIPVNFAEKLIGYTGAEIEQLAKDSLFDGLEKAFQNLVPLSRTMKEEIQSLREWAKTRARFANTPESEPENSRKIRQYKPNQKNEN